MDQIRKPDASVSLWTTLPPKGSRRINNAYCLFEKVHARAFPDRWKEGTTFKMAQEGGRSIPCPPRPMSIAEIGDGRPRATTEVRNKSIDEGTIG